MTLTGKQDIISAGLKRHSPRGQDLVEFSLVLALLVLFLFGALDLGRMFHAAIVITNASREGARFATLNPGDSAGVVAAVEAEAQSSGINLADGTTTNIIISCPPSLPPAPAAGCGMGNPVRVTVEYDFELFMANLLPLFILPGSAEVMTLTRSTEMLMP